MSVQYFDDAGERHEVVGILERAEPQTSDAILHIRRRDDTVVAVRLSRIRAGKVVPAAHR